MKTSVVFVIVLLMLDACATTPVPISQASAGIYNPYMPVQFRTPANNKGQLVVVRDSGIHAHGLLYTILVDNQEVGALHPSQMLMVYLAPGKHTIVSECDVVTDFGFGSERREHSSTFLLGAGQTVVFGVKFSSGVPTLVLR